MALGYIISRLIYRYPTSYDALVPINILSEAVKIMIQDLDSGRNLYLSGSAKALGEIGRYTTSNSKLFRMNGDFNSNNKDKGKEVDNNNKGEDDDTFSTIINKLIKIVKNVKDVKVLIYYLL